MNQGDLLISKTPPEKRGSLMIFANGGVQDRGYERKREEVRSQNQWDFRICPSNDRAMFSSQTEARNGGNYF